MTDENSTQEIVQAEATPEVELSLREQLEQAFNPTEEVAQEEGAEDATAPEQENAEEQGQTQEITEENSEEESPLSLPNELKSWNEQEQEAYRILSETNPEQAELLFNNRFKQINTAFHDKSEQLADYKRKYDSIGELFGRHEDELARAGMSPLDAVNKLMAVNKQMLDDPNAAIKELARANGVSLTDLVGGAESLEDDYVDPDMKSMKDELLGEINALKAQQNQVLQAKTQSDQNNINKEINSFREAKDDNGNSTSPHFDAVREDMSKLATAGISTNLKELYEMAVFRNPELRSSLVSNDDKVTSTDKQAQVNRARKAGKSVTKGKVSAKAKEDFSELSTREHLRKNLNL